MIRIVSNGLPHDTHVYGPDGVELKGVTRVEVLPISGNDDMVHARVTFEQVKLDVRAEQLPPEPEPAAA